MLCRLRRYICPIFGQYILNLGGAFIHSSASSSSSFRRPPRTENSWEVDCQLSRQCFSILTIDLLPCGVWFGSILAILVDMLVPFFSSFPYPPDHFVCLILFYYICSFAYRLLRILFAADVSAVMSAYVMNGLMQALYIFDLKYVLRCFFFRLDN